MDPNSPEALLAKAIADLDTANASIQTLNGTVTALTKERDSEKASVTRLTGELATANGQLATVNQTVTDLQGQVEAANKKEQDFDARVAAKAAQIAAQSGGAHVEISGKQTTQDAGVKDLKALYAQCEAIKDPHEQRAFYLKNIKGA